MRKFEKITFEPFKKDISDNRELYNSFELPKRDSDKTAGYDFSLIEDITIKPGEIKKIPTGIKALFNSDEVLLLVVRSGTGFKYNIRLTNQLGVIDADYYNNKDNEGHMWLSIQNESTEEHCFSKGESLVQGVFIKYLTTDDDEKRNIERRSTY